jgi:sugar phosphate isomerase/epimerase
MSKNKFGICEWVFPVRGPETLYHAKKLGFDGIQITELGGYEAGYPLLKQSVQSDYKRIAEETGIEIQALHLWSLCRLACMIHPIGSEAGKIGVESIKAAIKACTDLDIPVLMITSGFISQIKNEKDFYNFGQHLKIACELGGEKGVGIVFESALKPEEILIMIDLVGSNLKICYDIFNPIRFNNGCPKDEIRVLRNDVIDHFHMKDGPENMIGCSLLGKGSGNYMQTVAEIKKTGYKGWFITENYYGDYPLNKLGGFDDLARADLKTMRETLGD